jgi:TRIAD3 protein (E3 ubiquitin-protein ligase RNF216)
LDWVARTVAAEEGGALQDANPEDADDGDDEEDNLSSDGDDDDNGIECGCCFSKFRFVSHSFR